MLHSPQIEIIDCQVPQVTYSDHLPLVVDFNVKVPEDLRMAERDIYASGAVQGDLHSLGAKR